MTYIKRKPKKKRDKDKWKGFKFATTMPSQNGITDEERDDRAKNLMILLTWVEKQKNIEFLESLIENNKQFLQNDHIQGKGAHGELRYKMNNWQLLSPGVHRQKHDSGQYLDYRSKDLKKIIKLFDFTE